jgi:hypothetical protein
MGHVYCSAGGMPQSSTAFATIEGTQEYVQLLGDAIDEALRDAADDMADAGSERHLDALRLVDYKLHQLRAHVTASSRILNDLRTLRRLLLHERESVASEP